ncbi:MAG TPA: hypothetical protein VGB07_18545, partial [Blastocatellia bacterium]
NQRPEAIGVFPDSLWKFFPQHTRSNSVKVCAGILKNPPNKSRAVIAAIIRAEELVTNPQPFGNGLEEC